MAAENQNANVNNEQEPTKIDPQGSTETDRQETAEVTDEQQAARPRAEENAPPVAGAAAQASAEATNAIGRSQASAETTNAIGRSQARSFLGQRWVKFAGLGLAGLLIFGVGAGIRAEVVDAHFDHDRGDRDHSVIYDHDHEDEYR